ncbi:MAG TPA: IS1634 family transposase [Flavobacteriales bacterium]|nr:IS1634 family transposase [Flavobacteriales bacterium]
MFIQGIKRRGHTYYAVYHGKRLANKVVRETKLYIGKLEDLDEPKRIEIENKLKKLQDTTLIQKFHNLLYSTGYTFPSPVSTWNVKDVYSYGPELALHKICEEIDLINVINRHTNKGGGPDLGMVVEAMIIARNCDPCSYYQLPDWYSRSSLPFFLSFPPSEITYQVSLNALDYLQPETTVAMQVDLYENIKHVYGYECERLDIDLTSTYFEGKECILAMFGYSRDHRSDRPQIVIAFVVDQKGVLVTHRVWPGNQTDAKSLEQVDTCLREDFALKKAPRVVDRGIATWKNIDYMDEKKERYLVALRAGVKNTGLLEEIETPKDEWVEMEENSVAASVIKGRRKYVVAWTASVAETNKKERMTKVTRAENKLNKLLESVRKGKVESKKQRDEKSGWILKNFAVKKFLEVEDVREDEVSFTITRKKALLEAEKYDGYQVFVTTETDMSEKDVIDSYKIRDEIEKAIQTLKSALGLHPQYVRTKEHVLGNIFVCATAYQLRSILRLKLRECGFDMSVEEAMKTLERLKAVHIAVGNEGNVEVYRKLSGLNGETRTLVEVFNMSENGKFPEVISNRPWDKITQSAVP